MDREDKLLAICDKIYTEVFLRATPSCDFKELSENKNLSPEWYLQYYLTKKEQDSIIRKHIRNLNPHEQKRVVANVKLGWLPTDDIEIWHLKKKIEV